MDNLSIGVVILNWNNVQDTIQCVLSIDRQTYNQLEMVIIDNGSEDDSVFQLQQRFPDRKIISTGINLGYAGGNNIGIRYLLDRDMDAILILNNDVVLVRTAINEMVETLNQNEEIRLVAPVTISFEDPPKVIESGARFNPYNGYQNRLNQGADPDDLKEQAPFDVDIAPGCAFLAHKDLFGKVGFLPEHYFLYFEETDWCLDVKRSGFRIVCQPNAIVKHKNASALGFGSPLFTYYLTRNQFYFYQKHLVRSVLHRMIVFSVVREIKRFSVDILSGRTQNAFSRALGVYDFLRGTTGSYPWKYATSSNG